MVDKEKRRIDVPDLIRKDFETRKIVVVLGIDFHEADILYDMEIIKNNPRKYPMKKYSSYRPPLAFLRHKFGSSFEIEDDTSKIEELTKKHSLDGFTNVRKAGQYTSDKQKVHFIILVSVSKKDFKLALETKGLHVIYFGHARYGRGACFDTHTGRGRGIEKHQRGHHWEQSVNDDNGLFRLGYPYVPVSIEDISHHQYFFAPVPVEDGVPSNEKRHPFSRHPHARKSIRKITLPLELRHLVYPPTYESRSHQYYGLTRRGKTHFLLNAGWTKTLNAPYDLGTIDMKCKVFCHFGCSSRLHFWQIVRKKEYKGWQRPKPPTDKFAYFTTAPSDQRITPLWLYNLLSYDKQNNFKPWWKSLENAKKKTNNKLKSLGTKYRLY
jgi:hypothetical protein